MKTLIISGLCTLSLALPVAGADYQFVANKIRCNDINITAFAYQYKAHKTHKLLSHYYQGRVDITDIVLGDSMGIGQPALVTSINAEQ